VENPGTWELRYKIARAGRVVDMGEYQETSFALWAAGEERTAVSMAKPVEELAVVGLATTESQTADMSHWGYWKRSAVQGLSAYSAENYRLVGLGCQEWQRGWNTRGWPPQNQTDMLGRKRDYIADPNPTSVTDFEVDRALDGVGVMEELKARHYMSTPSGGKYVGMND
jgi:hypothetical protein